MHRRGECATMIFSSVSSQQLSAIPRVCTGSTGGGPSSMMGCSSMTLAPPFSRGMPRSPAAPGSTAPPSPPFSGRARGAARLGPPAAPCQQADVMLIGPQQQRCCWMAVKSCSDTEALVRVCTQCRVPQLGSRDPAAATVPIEAVTLPSRTVCLHLGGVKSHGSTYDDHQIFECREWIHATKVGHARLRSTVGCQIELCTLRSSMLTRPACWHVSCRGRRGRC